MRKIIHCLFVIVSILILSACGSATSQEESECKEIANTLQNDLSSKTLDKNIQLKFYYLEEIDNQIFIEEYHSKLNSIDYGVIDRETKKIDWLDGLKQTTQDLKNKYMDEKNLVYETTIDYANKEG